MVDRFQASIQLARLLLNAETEGRYQRLIAGHSLNNGADS